MNPVRFSSLFTISPRPRPAGQPSNRDAFDAAILKQAPLLLDQIGETKARLQAEIDAFESSNPNPARLHPDDVRLNAHVERHLNLLQDSPDISLSQKGATWYVDSGREENSATHAQIFNWVSEVLKAFPEYQMQARSIQSPPPPKGATCKVIWDLRHHQMITD